MQNRSLTLLFLATLPVVCGCVSMHPTRSGFLGDYTQLVTVDKKDLIRIKPVDGTVLAAIDSFYIEPVDWWADDLGQPASSERMMIKMRNALQASLAEEFGKILPIVDEIGPRTAIVRAAITGVQEAKPFANLFLAVQIAGPLFNGGASVEIEVLSPEGQQITAESAGFRGHDWDAIGYFWRPNHTCSALRKASKKLAAELAACQSQ